MQGIAKSINTGCLPITSNRISWKPHCLYLLLAMDCEDVYRLLQIGLVGNTMWNLQARLPDQCLPITSNRINWKQTRSLN